ncbi:MAG: hypothetical protein Tsb0017_07730 [Geothermobacteraceae bacterium]
MRRTMVFCLFILLLAPLPPRVEAARVKEAAEKQIAVSGPDSVEERRLLAEIARQKKRLGQREEAVRQRELELDSLQLELDKKLEKLEAQRAALEKLLKEKETAQQERIAELAKMYEKMDKTRVARLMETMDWSLARDILAQIKTKTRGKIIAEMSPSNAVRFTREYSSLVSN